jgi:tRNA dimethylallyltransferase
MFQAGLVEETRYLVAQGLGQNRGAMQALGYRQCVEFLKGERSLEQTIELVKIRTRQFAKRQITWFKKYFHGREILLQENDGEAETAAFIGRLLEQTNV